MIVDANPIVTACLGRSRPLFEQLIASGIDLFVPEHQMREAQLVTHREATLRRRDPTAVFGWTQQALSVVPRDIYASFEPEARERLQPSGQADWPLVALALATGEAIWSNERDLFGIGLPVWNTHNISRAPRSAVAAPGQQ